MIPLVSALSVHKFIILASAMDKLLTYHQPVNPGMQLAETEGAQ